MTLLRALSSSLISLVLAVTLLWGGCISCEQYFTFGKSHGCCDADGHCKTKAPSKKNSPRRDCNQIAFDHHKSIDLHFDLPVTTAERIPLRLPRVDVVPRGREALSIDPSPPDLQVLYSTFLI